MLFEWEQSRVVYPSAGLERCRLAMGGNLMAVQLKIDTGVEAPAHSHVHEQISYILEGRFEFTIDGKKYLCKAGDSLYIAPNLVHGILCLEKGAILDIFTPQREDLK